MKVRFLHPAIGAFAVRLPEAGVMVVGRDGETADIEITWDPQISRRHAKLWLEGGQLYLQDLGSRNGCWYGQKRLEGKQRLEPGSSLLVGETALLIPDEAPPPDTVDGAETFESPAPAGYAWSVAEAATQPYAALAALDLFDDDERLDIDLPKVTPPPPAPTLVAVPLPAALRSAGPRFVSPSRVRVHLDRVALKQLWGEELSKGGLFVPTETPPAVGTPLQVRFDLGDRRTELNAHVVAMIPAAADGHSPAGVGLHIPELLGEKGAAVLAFIEGRVADIAPDPVPPPPTEDVDPDAQERAAHFLRLTEQNRFYDAIGVVPGTDEQTIEAKIAELAATFERAHRGASPPQAARIEAASATLERIHRVLRKPAARLEYDFRSGHVRAQERIAAAREHRGPDVPTLRRVWNRVHVSKVEQAAQLTRSAFQARQEHDIVSAIQYGQRALEMNPFFEELEKTVEVWRGLTR